MKRLICLALVFLMFASGTASAGEIVKITTASGERLTGAQLEQLLVGNTEIGEYRWSGRWNKYREYFNPDGSIRGRDGSENYSGKWWIVSDTFCAEYSGSGDGCYSYVQNDDGFTVYNSSGEIKARVHRVEKGNSL